MCSARSDPSAEHFPRGLAHFNRLPDAEAVAHLMECCGSRRWARTIAAGRPYADIPELLHAAQRSWWNLSQSEWLDAFAAHPQIGESAVTPARARAESGAPGDRWAADEQSGTRDAPTDLLHRLAEANRTYRNRFGYIFIVCATGKSAAEMLALLEARLTNEPEDEIRIAAEEQRKITELRLRKLLSKP